MTTAQADQIYAAKWDIDSARGHTDTVVCLIDSAIEHLDGARRGNRIGLRATTNFIGHQH